MSEADNIALYRRLIEDGIGVGNLELLDELLDPDITLPTIDAFAVSGLRTGALILLVPKGNPDQRSAWLAQAQTKQARAPRFGEQEVSGPPSARPALLFTSCFPQSLNAAAQICRGYRTALCS